ncbi:carbohydrate binding domain-containing protein [Mucilaginibacter sp. SMC90]|uniref:carbohydrate binding domain-containing protein n=1 Tax=Mucilaginibacter sp. SMC90 TaxID=2929803 RepID=UPI001FB42E53|nr:carbohydrate binding domain-containing protein [Mucilaginibacter sp. SMC90]UOE47764.1 carbohydrate binding domain-containing protein [Mucilaginibacter sp. SMC90]
MRKRFLKTHVLAFLAFTLASGGGITARAASLEMVMQQTKEPAKDGTAPVNKKEERKEERKGADNTEERGRTSLVINGTDKTGTFIVNGQDLQTDLPIKVSVSGGFSVSPATIPANAKNVLVTVTLNSSKKQTLGKVVLRSGDFRSYVNLKGFGTPLTPKDISKSPVYAGGDAEKFNKAANDGFKPTSKGYTVEFKVNTDDARKEFFPYVVNDKGVGFKAFVNSSGTGLYSAANDKAFVNPATSGEGGLGKFYNDDKRSHTYRYAVTPDNRIFVYRDGLPIDTVRAVDYGPQPDFTTETGDPVENLLKNPGFEGDYDTRDGKMVKAIEGWDIAIGDIYNSDQSIRKQEITNQQDADNHILSMERYKWSDGWGAAEISQVVNVAPNETYTLSALVRGGVKKEGTLLGKLKIEELQDGALGKSVEISSDKWETYSLDYTTSAECKQIRIVFYLERDKWGANITPLEADNVKLTGKSRIFAPKIGFTNKSSNIKYFTYDLTGAYAPLEEPKIAISTGIK